MFPGNVEKCQPKEGGREGRGVRVVVSREVTKERTERRGEGREKGERGGEA